MQLRLVTARRWLVVSPMVAIVGAIVFLAATAPRKDPSEAARLNNLGCAYMNQQLFEKGLKFFEDASVADPNLRAARINQGIALLSLAKIDAAQAILNEAAKADPRDPHVWYALGMLNKNSANSEAAVEDFKHVIEIDDSDADTWYFLGTVYSQFKQFPQAIDAFEHALKLNPLHASAQFGLSRAYQQSGDRPHAREHLARFQYITQNKLGSAISLAYGEQGKYSLAEESPSAPVKVPPQIPVKFEDVTREAGLTSKPSINSGVNVYFGSGACFIDYDNDGEIDLFLSDNGPQGGMALYHNLGGGRFEDVTKKAGLNPELHAIACTVGDYDNDGWPDVAVSREEDVMLFQNQKTGTFKQAASDANLGAMGLNVGVTFIDYDHDGDLDLVVTRSGDKAEWGKMYRNNGNGTFTDVTEEVGFADLGPSGGAGVIGTDYNNDRAIDILAHAFEGPNPGPTLLENPREGRFRARKISSGQMNGVVRGAAVLDFDHDGWMDIALTHEWSGGNVSLWRNDKSKKFERVGFPNVEWQKAWGITAFDYDNDGWVDLVAVGETKEGKGEIRLFRNLGPDGWKDVTAGVGLDKIQLKDPRAIITGDYDNDGATDLLVTQNQGPAVLLKNEGGNKNNWLQLALKGLNDNKSAIGTKVEVFSDGIRQRYEIYGSNGYLGQNSPYLTVGLGQAKQADVVRMLWPTGVLQDEVEIAANKQQEFTELDRRGSSCPTLFVWDGERYQLVSDILGAGVVGHWVAPGERNIPRPTEWVKIDRNLIRELPPSEDTLSSVDHVGTGALTRPAEHRSTTRIAGVAGRHESQNPHPFDSLPSVGPSGQAPVAKSATRMGHPLLSFRLMEPMEEVVYLDAVKLVAVDHPASEEVYPNEYFASNPPYPEFKVITSGNAKPPAGAWDDKGNNLLPDLLAHKYVGNFDLLRFKGFAKPHSLILDLGEPYHGGPLRLLMHGEIEYFTATGMYAASQAGIEAIAPYVEAQTDDVGAGALTRLTERSSPEANAGRSVPARHSGEWVRVLDDMGFPAGLPKTITVDLTSKLPKGTTRIRITTNLQIYWDNILIDRSLHDGNFKLHDVPLTNANLNFHGYPRQIEDQPPGNVKYVYDEVSRTGPYARQAGEYTQYGDVLPLLSNFDDKLVVFGSGEEVSLEFDSSKVPPIPQGWARDYFFQANGYEKDMDFYAAHNSTVEPLPFRRMRTYPYAGKSFPSDAVHLDYVLKYNTRFMSGNEPRGYSYEYEMPSTR